MVDETVNTQSPEEEYEYEYIELAEGEELPADADYEYEYIEVPVESVPHEEAVSEPVIENVSAPVEPVPAVTAEPEPAPTEAAPVAASEPEVVSEPVSTPQEAVAAQPVSPTVAESETLPVENVVSAEEEAVWEVVPETQVTEVSETVAETVAMAESAPVAEMVAAQVESEPGVNVAVPNSPVPVSEEFSNTEALPEDDNSLLELSQNEESLSEMLVDVSASGNVVQPTVETDVDLESELFGASAPVNIDEIPFNEVKVNEVKAPVLEAQTFSESAPAVEPEAEVVPEPVAVAAPEPTPVEPAAIVEPEAEVVPEPVVVAAPEPTPVEPAPTVEPEAEVVPEPVAVAVPEPTPVEPAPTVEPGAEVVPEPVVVAVPEPTPVEQAPTVEPGAEVVPEPVAVAAPEPTPVEPAPTVEPGAEVVLEPVDLQIDETEVDVIQNILSGENAESVEVQTDISAVENSVSSPITASVQETAVIETINPEEIKSEISEDKQEALILETISTPIVPLEEISSAEEIVRLSEPEIVSDEVSFQVLPINEENYISYRDVSKSFGRMSGVQTFQGDETRNVILLNEIDYKEKELESWSIIVFKSSLISLPEENSSVRLEKNSETVRYARVVKNGTPELSVFNEEEFHLERNNDEFVQGKNHFIYAKPGFKTGIIVNDFENISLADKEGKAVVFNVPVSGILAGPGNAKLYFANIREVVVATAALVRVDEDKLQAKNAKWYSGSLSDKYFELSAGSSSCEFIGNEEVRSIHVNVGTSTYGWNVTFDNGIVMSFRDLQEFQNKHGALPSANGTISHGQLNCKFNNIERIVVYEIPQYFAYGRM